MININDEFEILFQKSMIEADKKAIEMQSHFPLASLNMLIMRDYKPVFKAIFEQGVKLGCNQKKDCGQMPVKQIHRTKVVRNDNGEWIHPELGEYWEINFGGDVENLDVEQWEELKRYFNIDTITFDLGSCVSEKVYEKMMDSCDLSKWKPIPPNHYFLISINYTEDGASAVFAKQKSDV